MPTAASMRSTRALRSTAAKELRSQPMASRKVTSFLPFGSSIGSLNLRDQDISDSPLSPLLFYSN